MQGLGFFVAFFAVIIILIITSESGGLFQNVAPEPFRETATTTVIEEAVISSGSTGTGGSGNVVEPEPRSNIEIERDIEELFQELDSLKTDLREARLREPRSPHAGLVTLGTGNARATDEDLEYLTIYANQSNRTAIPITGWRVESYVTGEDARIPEGALVMESRRTMNDSTIFLEPGEDAYLMTGETPFNVSFHENTCTGYLAEDENIYPSLLFSCPLPIDEMEEFGDIDLDDDDCYDYVESLNRCFAPSDDEVEDADVGGSCERFIFDDLNYSGCVENHRFEPFFDNVGAWRIYLGSDDELWRDEREIIRLLDENGRVIDVLEY